MKTYTFRVAASVNFNSPRPPRIQLLDKVLDATEDVVRWGLGDTINPNESNVTAAIMQATGTNTVRSHHDLVTDELVFVFTDELETP